VTHDGTNYLVVWQDRRAGTDWDIYAARVDSQGVAKETLGVAVSSATGDQQAPAVGHDGTNAVVVWEDHRAKNNWDVYGARVTSAGVVGDTQGFAVASDANFDETTPVTAGSGDGRVLVVYRRPEDDTVYGTDRVQARVVVTLAANGSACSSAVDCKSGLCVDGACCNTACGGGVTTDCQACSVKAGAAADGVCGPASSGTECRPAAGSCDAAETCDGTATTCPADVFKTAGSPCRAAAGDCDVAEVCDGASAACPADGVKPAGTACRAVAGDCDVAETCDGATGICPADLFKSSSEVCRPAAGECDAEETCSGQDKDCPADGQQPDGAACTGGVCKAGACVPVGDAGPLPEAGVDADMGPREAGPDATPSGDAVTGDASGDTGPDSGLRCFGPTCEEPDDGCGCRIAGRTGRTGRPRGLPVVSLLLLFVVGVALRRARYSTKTRM